MANIIKDNGGFRMPFDNSFILHQRCLPLAENLNTGGAVLSRAFNPSVDNPPWDLTNYKQEKDVLLRFTDSIHASKLENAARLSESTKPSETSLKPVESHYKPVLEMESDDSYCEDFAELKYYDTKPTCFMILGKETISSRLAKRISDYWGCVCIDVEQLLKDYLKTIDLVSMHLNTTLKSGEVLRNANIQALLENRVSALDIQHRGYVLCGLPFIPVAPDDPTVQQQMSDIFEWELPPDVLIYLTCPDADVVNFRQQLRYDLYDSGNEIDMSLLNIGKRMQRVYSNKKEGKKDEKAELYEDNYYEVEEERLKYEATTEKYLVTRTRDLPTYVEAELLQYHKHILPVVEYYILRHDPQFIIKLDGRASSNHSFLVLKEKLEVLPIQRVFKVENLTGALSNLDNSPAENLIGQEEREEDEEYPEGQTPQDVYDELSIKNTPGSRFRWRWSHWGSKCPVALIEGRCVDGNPNYAVRFMDKIFFLSDKAAMNRFILNPRKFLRRPSPQLACRIGIVGPKQVGKSTLAQFLAATFHGKVISWHQIKTNKIHEKRQNQIEEKREEAIQDALEEVRAVNQLEYEQAVANQPKKLQEWREKIKAVLLQYVDSYRPSKEFYDKLRGSDKSEDKPVGLTQIKYTESQMQVIMTENNIPAWDNPQFAELLLDNTDELMKYCPNELLTPIPEVIVVSETDPAVIEAGNRKLMEFQVGDLELTTEEIGEALVERINEIEISSHYYSTLGAKRKGGWIIKDFPLEEGVWEILERSGVVLDQVIYLKDSDVNQTNLLIRWIQRKESSSPEVKPNTSDLENIIQHMSPGFDNHDILAPMMQASYFSECVGAPIKIPWPTDPSSIIFPPIIVFQNPSDTDMEENTEPKFSLEDKRKEHPSIQNYYEVINNFTSNWENIKLDIESKTTIIELIVNDKTIIQLLYEAALKTLSLIRKAPHVMTDQEKSDEIETQIREQQGDNLAEDYDPEEEGLGGEMYDTRRYGDTSVYCPVAFRLNRVLWPGQPDFACVFQDKIYNMSSERAMEMFLEQPLEFAPFSYPPKGIPPLRICVVGAVGSGKSTISRILAQRLGVHFCDFTKSIEDCLMTSNEKVGRKNENSPDQLIESTYEGEQERLNTIRKYLLTGTELSDTDMIRVVAPYWNQEPYKSEGFVFDGYPFRIPDLDFMKKYYLIPDIIIELEVSSETAVERALKEHMLLWEVRQTEQRKRKEQEERNMLEQWESRKAARYKQLMMEFRRGQKPGNPGSEEAQEPKKRIFGPSDRTAEGQQLRKEQEEAQRKIEDETDTRRQSIITQLSEQEVEDWVRTEINEIIGTEFPAPPIVEAVFEEQEDAEERIQEEIEGWHEQDSDDLETLRETFAAENIPWETVNAETERGVELVIHNVMYLVDKFKYRKRSGALERVYEVPQKVAEELIQLGYYFLSKFGRWCPVQIAKKVNPIQMYIPTASKAISFPVIHRKYIYFLANRENEKLFIGDPLHYISQDPYVPIIPLRIGIVGPPKCGKTTLAERLANEFSVRVTSIGSALRESMFLFPTSKLAQSVNKHKEDGTRIPEELKIQAVECEMLANKSLVQGVVFDGFPHTMEQVLELSLIGCVPTLIIHLDGNENCTMDGLRSLLINTEYYSRDPVFPDNMIMEKYKNWEKVHKPFVDFMSHEYQNVVKIPAERCKWWVYKHSLNEIYDNLWQIKNYVQLANEGVPISLRALGISSNEFLSRQSLYQHYCPVCLTEDELNTSGFPPKCTGLIQFEWFYYWVCPKHYDRFMASPKLYIPPMSTAKLPQTLPLPRGEHDKMDQDSFYMDGLCIVHYHDTPGLAVARETGLWYLMVEYDGKIFHFCSQSCQDKFIRQPEKYGRYMINYREEPFPLSPLSELPNLGYMEQTMATALVAACLSVDSIRPKYPCLDLAKSGAIYLGTYLKTINPKLGGEAANEYQKVLLRLQEQKKKVSDIAKKWQTDLNPFVQPFQSDAESRSWVFSQGDTGSSLYSDNKQPL